MIVSKTDEQWNSKSIDEQIEEIRYLIDFYEKKERHFFILSRIQKYAGLSTPLLFLLYPTGILFSTLVIISVLFAVYSHFAYRHYCHQWKLNCMEKRSFQPCLEKLLFDNYGIPKKLSFQLI